MSLKNKVAIIGVGCTKFGENFDLDYKDMLVESYTEALEDAGIGPKEIDAAWLATAFPDMAHYEGNSGSSLADPLNLFGIPTTHVTNYCATGMDAIRNAAMAVA
ncbi:MAG TPA: acetyl-CoA acetyltransferase, partial [Bacteroidetes bacterium]|nr:acetyl-CoA acetyltransferase [Bacteroidota bacterium]